MLLICSTRQSRLEHWTFTKALPLPLHLFLWHHGWMWCAKSWIFPWKNPFPSVSATDYLKQTAAYMLYLLRNKKSQATSPRQVAGILNCATQMPHQSKTKHQVASPRVLPRVLPTPIWAPRMILPPHPLNSTQHDTTVAGKLFDPVTGWQETIDTLLAGKTIPSGLNHLQMKLADVS